MDHDHSHHDHPADEHGAYQAATDLAVPDSELAPGGLGGAVRSRRIDSVWPRS